MRLIEGTPKEIADFVFLQQSQRQLVRTPYSNETELIPILDDDASHTPNKLSKPA